jgi:hypothetical protein
VGEGPTDDRTLNVIVGRAMPAVRDGLKPAHRRVLTASRDAALATRTGTCRLEEVDAWSLPWP